MVLNNLLSVLVRPRNDNLKFTGAACSLLVALTFSVRLRAAKRPGIFNRIATLAVIFNLCDQDPNPATCLDTTTVSEIVAASEDGGTLIYTDAETGNIRKAPGIVA